MNEQRLTIVECGEYTRPDYTPAGNPIRGVVFALLMTAFVAMVVVGFVHGVQFLAAWMGVQ